MYRCSYVESDGDVACNEVAELFAHLPLCEEHRDSVRQFHQTLRRSTAVQSAKVLNPYTFPGKCYIVLLTSGHVKIGYSNTEELLQRRMTTLKRELGPIVQLLVTEGGFVMEAFLHDKFNHLRVPGNGELFEYGEEIATFISEHQ